MNYPELARLSSDVRQTLDGGAREKCEATGDSLANYFGQGIWARVEAARGILMPKWSQASPEARVRYGEAANIAICATFEALFNQNPASSHLSATESFEEYGSGEQWRYLTFDNGDMYRIANRTLEMGRAYGGPSEFTVQLHDRPSQQDLGVIVSVCHDNPDASHSRYPSLTAGFEEQLGSMQVICQQAGLEAPVVAEQ